MSDAGNQGSPPAPPSNWPPSRFDPSNPSKRDAIFFGPHGLRAGWSAVFYLGLFLVFGAVATGIEWLFNHPPAERTQLSVLTLSTLFYGELLSAVAALAATAVMARLENRSFADYGLPLRRAFQGRFWQGAVWGLAQISFIVLSIAALKGYSFGVRTMAGSGVFRYALEWGGAFLLVGFFEEIFFRGYLQATLARGMRFWPAAILLSLVFGAVHLTNPGEGLAGIAGVFLVGLFLCFTLRRTGSLWFAIGWHAAFDFGETYLYSVPDSGIDATHQLLAASLHGPRWLTGGSVGPEGSVFAFVSLVLAFLLFAMLYRRKPATSAQS